MQAVSLSKIIEKMELVNLTPEIDVESIKVEQTDINRPALQLTGFFDHFPTDRVQVIGYVEYTYLKGMEEERKKYIYGEILSKKYRVLFSAGICSPTIYCWNWPINMKCRFWLPEPPHRHLWQRSSAG